MPSKPAKWFLTGLLLALALQWIQAAAFAGDWRGLLAVGERSALAPMITAELGPVPYWPDGGHDGQIVYAIARDLGGGSVTPLLDHAGYRYRRILYPALSALAGGFTPWGTFLAMVGWAAVAMGMATAGAALLANRWSLPRWMPLVVLLNPGVWLGVQMLTPDALGLGCALLGLGLWTRDRRLIGGALLAAAALAKDQYLVVALVAGAIAWGSTRRRALTLGAASTIPLLAWALWLSYQMGGGLSPRANLTWPMVGIIEAAPSWADVGTKDLVYTFLALLGTAACILGTVRATNPTLRWLNVAWGMLAITASSWVWDFGNNALRSLAPTLIFPVMALGRTAPPEGSATVASAQHLS
jgi:hypothetical protein